jgi:hypothetical protein
MLHHVVWQILTGISEKLITSIIKDGSDDLKAQTWLD